MHQPVHFRQNDREAMFALIRANPLGLLIHNGGGVLSADPVPFLIDAERGPHGVLRAHVARANPLWRAADGADVLVVFQDAGAYVTPSWYPSKRAHGKVVPTWNYATVHAAGTARAMEDPAWIRAQAEALTRAHEEPRPKPWRVDDAPADYLAQMFSAIVGIEIPIARLEGKWKVSQNRPAADRDGVSKGLREEGGAAGARIADLVDGARRP